MEKLRDELEESAAELETSKSNFSKVYRELGMVKVEAKESAAQVEKMQVQIKTQSAVFKDMSEKYIRLKQGL